MGALESTTRWSVDDVIKLAPDPSSAGAARRLSLLPVWSNAGSAGTLVWGRCQGSAREPYQVTVDLTQPSFRCNCPSRKQPCKHGLALLMLWASGEGSVAEKDRPADFAAEWVTELATRGTGQGAGAAAGGAGRGRGAEAAPPDPVAQAKRLADRLDTMTAGIDDFERWLFDLIRQGLATARHQPFSFWDNAAARLVDAQLPGLADRVRSYPAILYSGADWAERLLAELARGFLAVSAWRRRDDLPDDVVADLRVVIGWPRRVDEVLQTGPRLTDRWSVVGLSQHEDDNRLFSQRTWLVGERTGEVAVILDFAHVAPLLAVPEVPGSVVEAELALYPGHAPRRALFASDRTVVGSASTLPATDVAAALDEFSRHLAANPFADRFPLGLAGVTPFADGDRLALVDSAGAGLPMGGDTDLMLLLALSGGHPVDLFGEWDGFRFTPLTVAADGALVSL